MSQVLELITKVQDKQLAVVGKGQQGLVKVAGGVADAKSKLQVKLPVSGFASDLAQKVESVLGSPVDHLRHGAEVTMQWAEQSRAFQNELADVLASSPATEEPATV